MNKTTTLLAGLTVAGSVLLTGCSSAPEITGMWDSTGPSSTVYFYDDGSCEGMMSVDIGGPMYCTLSDDEADGYYTMKVRQSENTATYLVQPDGDDHLGVYNSSGTLVFELDRI
jgi:hypothetical protein